VYAAALQRGWTPASLVLDEPIAVEVSPQEVWEPANFDRRSLGPIRLRRALAQSRNLASIDLLDRVGIDYARSFAGRFGFEPADLPRSLTLALGAGAASLQQMAGAYAVFANGGFKIDPYLIARVEDGAGVRVFEADPPSACAGCWFPDPAASGGAAEVDGDSSTAERVLEPRLAYQMHSMLQDVIAAGTGRRARQLKRSDLAGKTGTTNDARDAWFCGYQKDLVAVAWMGFDDFSPLGRGETGGESALGLWSGFMGQALKGLPPAELPVPPGMLQVWVDGSSGALVQAGESGAVMEWVREEDADRVEGPDPAYYFDWNATGRNPSSIIESVF
jgi:penicillin-binding protein 1A